MTVIDRKFVQNEYPDVRIRQTVSVGVKGVGNGIQSTEQFATVTLYIPGFKGDTPVIGAITREFHIVEELGCNALIGNDILEPEGFVIDPGRRCATVRALNNMAVPLQVLRKPQIIDHRFVRTAQTTVVQPFTKKLIPIRADKLPDGTDYRFNPHFTRSSAHLALSGIFPEAVVNSSTSALAYYNNTDHNVKIPANARIGEIIEWDYNDRAVPEDEKMIDCFFSVAKVMPTLAFALHTGMTALRYAIPPDVQTGASLASQVPLQSTATNAFHITLTNWLSLHPLLDNNLTFLLLLRFLKQPPARLRMHHLPQPTSRPLTHNTPSRLFSTLPPPTNSQ